jgi:hypothetical protein
VSKLISSLLLLYPEAISKNSVSVSPTTSSLSAQNFKFSPTFVTIMFTTTEWSPSPILSNIRR